MEAILAIAAVGLLIIQAHRNYLIIKSSTSSETVIKVEVDYEALADAMEASWPAVTVSNDIQINYDKLAEALSQQPAPIITVPAPTVIPNPPNPWWQDPIVSDDQAFATNTTNELEINGFPVKRYPAR